MTTKVYSFRAPEDFIPKGVNVKNYLAHKIKRMNTGNLIIGIIIGSLITIIPAVCIVKKVKKKSTHK